MARQFTKKCRKHGETWHTDSGGCNICRSEAREKHKQDITKMWQGSDVNEKLDFLFTKVTGIEL